jgi:ribonuclease HII
VATFQFESEIFKTDGCTLIAGLDEAGRGALAGPVVAAAVILPNSTPDLLKKLRDVNDSKQLSAKKRVEQYQIIIDTALSFGIGSSSAQDVDRHGIILATKQAMQNAVQSMEILPEYLLIDGRIRLAALPLPQQSIIRGDSLSLSIAAASILAKVTRDRMMIALDPEYPNYGFARHKGYGTLGHREALELLGPTSEHRLSFAPIRTTLL